MRPFSFVGSLSSSKSILNRALIVQSFAPALQVQAHSQAEDVQKMIHAFEQFKNGQSIDCGAAGTVFRFMALRVARETGQFHLSGTSRLLERPQQELTQILGQLGSQVEWRKDGLHIRSWGWKVLGDALHIPMSRSSQFASAVVLNAWELPFELCLMLGPKAVSQGYFEMTLSLVKQLGMNVNGVGNEIRISRNQKVKSLSLEVEPDLSSLFALACCAAVNGQLKVRVPIENSLQPDRLGFSLLQQMGVQMECSEQGLVVEKTESLKPIDVDLTSAPDLVPSLAALAALASGTSYIRGATQLQFKESNRRNKVVELLKAAGRRVEFTSDVLVIEGSSKEPIGPAFEFNPDEDHRMAFAAAILWMAGVPLKLRESAVVNKSFPEFWSILGGSP